MALNFENYYGMDHMPSVATFVALIQQECISVQNITEVKCVGMFAVY